MATPTDPTTGSHEPTPPSTLGFGAREQADETRQASQTFANDTPTDVNFNAIAARSQALTVNLAGKSYELGHTRLQMIQERFIAGVPMGKAT